MHWEPQVPYRENTSAKRLVVITNLVRQSGGRGQIGHVVMKLDSN